MNRKKPKILIVDDENLIIDLLVNLLKDDYKTVIAKSGEQALKRLNSGAILPDLVLLDIVMPEMNGFEVCRHLKGNDRTCDIPVIFLTAKNDQKTIVRVFEKGAADYVSKPFNPYELLARVKTHLERKKLLKEIKREKEYTDNILKSMGESLIVITLEGMIEFANEKTLKLLGYQLNELLGKEYTIVIPEALQGERNWVEEAINKGDINSIEKTFLTKNGQEIPVLLTGSLMNDYTEESKLIVCVAQNISERKASEKLEKEMMLKMLSVSKLATLGEVSTGVAHEINQPLTYINSLIQSMKIDIKDKKESSLMDHEEDLDIAYAQIKRITRIINHLKMFGRKDDSIFTTIRIEDVLSNTLLLMEKRVALKNIKLVRRVGHDLPELYGNEQQLEQVLINLLQNAMDSFEESTNNAIIEIVIKQDGSGNFVEISFSDNGSGMDNEIVDRIYEPFFTTKEVGKGTGVGLSIVYGIIRDHRGDIKCESRLGKGTTFLITLPAKN